MSNSFTQPVQSCYWQFCLTLLQTGVHCKDGYPRRMDDEGGPVTVSYGRRESFVLADDMSDFFGTQRSIDGMSSKLGTGPVLSCVH